eukprot:TRINITY_DN12266_c0_g2_i1.p1 TRINITY_DN12266_c0_g2~~TRINITY_DN12266_c0_g2_i1.p1  ORF type:complete len:375 (-),score=18.72 TRINITY_DN12266_c0_g2_i1:156-1280(-)
MESRIFTCHSKFQCDNIVLWFYVGSTILSTLTLVARCVAARFSGLSFTWFHGSIFGILICVCVIRVHHVSAGCVGDVISLPHHFSHGEIAKTAIRNGYVMLPFMCLSTVFLLFLQDTFKVVHAVYLTFHDSRPATSVVPRQDVLWCMVCGKARNIWKVVIGFVVIVWYLLLFASDATPYIQGLIMAIMCLPMLVIATCSVFRIWNSIKHLQLADLCHSASRRGEDGCSVRIDDDTVRVRNEDSLLKLSLLQERWSALTLRSSVENVADGEFPRTIVQPVIQGLKRSLLLSVTCMLVFLWRSIVVGTLQMLPRNLLSSTDPLYVFFILPHLFLCEIFPVVVICALYLVPAIGALRDFAMNPHCRFRGEEPLTTSV